MKRAKIWLGMALATAGMAACPAIADIPTTTLTADGGPPPQKPSAPRTEQRASERPAPTQPQG